MCGIILPSRYNDTYESLGFFFALTFSSLLTGLLAGTLLLVTRPFQKWLHIKEKITANIARKTQLVYISLTALVSVYYAYDAVWPGQSFYEKEYENVTFRKIPSSAKFIRKFASYPDFHGDYCSSARIYLSRSDYKQLLYALSNDQRFERQTNILWSDEYRLALDTDREDNIAMRFEASIHGEVGRHRSVHFCKDGKTIYINYCKS